MDIRPSGTILGSLVALLLTLASPGIPETKPKRGAASPVRYVVTGVQTTRAAALDPDDPDSLAAYKHNFQDILTISRADMVDPPPSRTIEVIEDLGEAFFNLQGLKTERVIGELLPLRDRDVDELIVHSWGAAAVLEALSQGFLRKPPRRLIVVQPPQLTPWGGSRWRRLAERYPDMPIDVFVSRHDIVQRIREGAQLAVRPATALLSTDEEFTGRVLAYFTARNVRVHTFPTPRGPIDAHSLRHFFDFAAARGLYGLQPAVPVAPLPPGETVLDNTGDDAFLVAVSQATKRVANIEALASRQAAALRDVAAQDEASARELEALRWRYFASLLESTCVGGGSRDPYDTFVLFSATALGELARTHRGDLSGCGQALLAAVLREGQPVSPGWIRKEARRYRERATRAQRKELEAARREAERLRSEEARERAYGTLLGSGRTLVDQGDASRAIRLPNDDTGAMRDLRGVRANLGRFDGR